MTIHDELILELIKPNKWSYPTGDIVKIVGTANIKFYLEWSNDHPSPIVGMITPDIVVYDLGSEVHSINDRRIAIEVMNDWDWNYGKLMRQVKNYKTSGYFSYVVVVIPNEYKRFALLFRSQGFRVWLWQATIMWECMNCGNIIEEKGIIKPKCSECGSRELRNNPIENLTLKKV